jgi:tetratricopeptide (TPR) repeat protein
MPDWERREEYLRKAVELLEDLTTAHPSVPDYRHMLARCYREMPWIGRKPELATQARTKAIAILEDLARDFPDVPDYRHDLSETYAMPELPRVFPDAKDPDAQRRWQESLKGTRESLQKALDISESLVAEHPNVPDYATSQVRIRLALAGYLQDTDEARADENLRKALELQSSLVRRYPGTPPHQFMLALIQEWRGRLLLKRGQFAEARSMLEASVALLKELSQKNPQQWHLRASLHGNYLALAEALRGLGDPQAAAACERQAGELFSGR